jgi:hypothetical protein
MADTLQNANLAVTTSYTVAYTCPAATQAVVHTLNIGNADPVNSVNIGARVFRANNSSNTVLFENVSLPVGSGFVYPKSINLTPGDRIELIADANSRAQAFLSIIERN